MYILINGNKIYHKRRYQKIAIAYTVNIIRCL